MDGNYTYGEHFVMYINVKSLCCTPETNIIFCFNYISIKKTQKCLLQRHRWSTGQKNKTIKKYLFLNNIDKCLEWKSNIFF